MEGPQGGTGVHLLPCTASDQETCQIVTELVSWNNFLRGLRFEIREDHERCNQLHVTNTATAAPYVESSVTKPWSECLELLGWILTTHRCIGSVSLALSSTESRSLPLLSALCQNRCIKSVTVARMNTSTASAISTILPCLTNIEKLQLTPVEVPLDVLVGPLCALLESSVSLSSLHVEGTFAEDRMVDTLFKALLKNPTLTGLHFQDMSVHGSLYPQSVKEFLASTTMLKVLYVSTKTPSIQMAVLEGLLENWSVEKLSLDLFMVTEETTALISRIIETKPVIRMLEISRPLPLPPVHRTVYDCWIRPLMENDTLEEVRLPLYALHPETWSAFFRALPTKENLKKFHISSPFYLSRLNWLCAELKHSGSEEKVSLQRYTSAYDIEFLQSKVFSAVDLSLSQYEQKLAVLVQLPNCQQLTSVRIDFRFDDPRISIPLAEFLRSTRTLQKLDIRVMCVRGAGGRNQWWKHVLESLSLNKTLTKLVHTSYNMTIQDTEDMADSIKRNTCIRRLSLFYTPPENSSAFIRRLSKGIEENYRLTDVKYSGYCEEELASHWFAVQETTWRNSGLVSRAARIKQASSLDRYVTGAVERVARHPALLDEVALRAKLDRAELAVLVRDRLMQVRSMDGFMRAVGVVKERVICHPAEDGRMQLDDLNEDCWSHVRRYLVTDDVRRGAVQADSA
ncbi:uncharacterized protein LOC142771316 [Rhipicephalus microplus]|uniref:uncharacterized protein LOC142771316 n=1 Tax=Rhipicephalus microplus TaxID=6941 RepID=UPI003F6BF0EF